MAPRRLLILLATTLALLACGSPVESCQSAAANIFSQLGDTGWRMFGQSMPSPCAKTNSGDYVTRHLPALYYTRISAAACAADVIPLPVRFTTLRRPFAWVARLHRAGDGQALPPLIPGSGPTRPPVTPRQRRTPPTARPATARPPRPQ
jgi:hypothetical protein